MLKRDITYEGFDGQTVTESYYFNLSRTEIIELQLSEEGGFEAYLQKIIDSKDMKVTFEVFKKIVLLAYGVRSDDGKRFIKNDEVREEFSQTAAFDALVMDLATVEDSSANFIKGVIPAALVDDITATMTPPLPPGN